MDKDRIRYRITASLENHYVYSAPTGMGSSDDEDDDRNDPACDWLLELSPNARKEYFKHHPNSKCNPNYRERSKMVDGFLKLIPSNVHKKLNRLTGGKWRKTVKSTRKMGNLIDDWTKQYGEFKRDHETLNNFILFAAAAVLGAGL